MSNILWGIPVALACIAGYGYAWKLAREERFGTALSCIVLCGLILRIYTGADLCLHEWDERYHALVSKHLIHHWLRPTLYDNPLLPYNYKDWTTNHVWLHKQPLALWLTAISIKLFGLHAFVVRIPAILLSTFAIKLVYDIAAAWYGRQIAIVSAFLFSIHGLIIELAAGRTSTDSVDAVFLFFVVLSVWLSILAVRRKRVAGHLLLGLAIGLGILTKWLPALIALPIWMLIAYPAFKGERLKMTVCFSSIIVAAIAIALPWQLYILHVFPAQAGWELSYNGRHLSQAVEAHDGNSFYYFDHLRMQYGELIYLPVAWFTWQGIKSRKAADYAILAWFWLTYLFFSVVATKMEAYTVIAAPAVFIMNAIAFVRLGEYLRTAGRYRQLLFIVWLCLVALPVRYCIERVKLFTVMDRNPSWNQEIDQLRHSPLNNSRTILFNCSHPVETMFFTDCIAYERQIDSSLQKQLSRDGYTVLQSH